MSLSAQTLDPVTVEVVRNKLDGIANEMELTLLKSSFSPIVKEGLDASASLFTLQGETLAQAIAIPIHLATLIPCVARFLIEFPIEEMREGDIYCMNDPYLGGTHLPDIAVVMPVFARGRPIAFAAAMTHHQDVGGMAPGSVPTNATEDFSGGHPAAAAETARRRRIQRHAAEDPAAQCAHPGDLRGRPDGAGRGMHGRGAAALGARQHLRRQSSDRDFRRVARPLGGDDPRCVARDSAGHLPRRRLPRQRRHRSRPPHSHRGRGHGRRRRHDCRLRRLLAAGARAVQRRAVGQPGGELLSPCVPSPIRASRPTAAASGRSR